MRSWHDLAGPGVARCGLARLRAARRYPSLAWRGLGCPVATWHDLARPGVMRVFAMHMGALTSGRAMLAWGAVCTNDFHETRPGAEV
eukprot:364832-Chlamydomonas_euryale.AAC.3